MVKQLFLKEEIRLTRRKTESAPTESIELREEEVTITRAATGADNLKRNRGKRSGGIYTHPNHLKTSAKETACQRILIVGTYGDHLAAQKVIEQLTNEGFARSTTFGFDELFG